jgi:hypothetical protein
MCALELAGDLLETEPARPPARVRTAEDRDQAAALRDRGAAGRVTAVADDHVVEADVRAKSLTDDLQQGVAGQMALAVVDLL